MDKKQELAKEAKKNINELAELLEVTSEGVKPTERKLKAQTVANKKWEEKTGVQAKTYKLDAQTVKKFGKACESSGKTQSEVLTAFMMAYSFIFSPPIPEHPKGIVTEMNFLERASAGLIKIDGDEENDED